ncbi:MAG: hypothetical protein IKT14_04470, partial [Clostridiales bacterium]|nr:hypothetical protein [Clostridiales bacterium]
GGDHDGEYTFCIPVVSAAMTAPIDVTVNYGTNGTVTEDKTVTVEEYADVIINEPGMDTDIVAAAKALKLYGYYSQVKFGINTNILPDITGYSVDQNISGASYAPAQDQDEAFAGATVSFLSETNVNLYFKKSVLGAAAPEMTVNYGGSPETITAVSSGSYYVYTVKGPSGTGFSATQYTSEFTYSVGNTSGTYSVATYLAAVVDKNANPEMVNLAQAYYNFAEKVSALQ